MNLERRGAPLAQQALLAARTMRASLQEFGNTRTGRSRTTTFPMIDALHAINQGETHERIAATVALQEFMHAPSVMRRQFRAQLQELVTAGDFPEGATIRAYIDKFLITDAEMDTGYEEIFAIHDEMTAQAQLRRDGFKLLDVTSGLTFKKRKPGEPIKFFGLSGDETFVKYDMYGGGISMDRTWWDDQDYMLIGDALTAFRETGYSDRADAFYGLITAISASYNYSTGSDLAAKINGAVADILRAVKGKGLKANAQSTFVIMYAPEQAGNVDTALSISTDIAKVTATGKQSVQYRFKRVPTNRVPASGTGSGIYIILPKNKLKGGYRMDLTLFGQFNIAQYADDIAGYLRYAGAIGELNQIRRIPTS